MSGMLILCVAVLAGAPDSGPDELEAYRAAAARAGRDAGAHVDLALWCERHGLDAERLKHLALAAVLDPANATARGLLGLVHDGDAWRRPEAVAERVRSDPELAAARAEYESRRSKAPYRADEQWKLALWCERHGLKAEATAHLASVVRLDPSRDSAWKHLGYKKQNGRWMTDEQIRAQKADVEAQRTANRRWKQDLERWRSWLGQKDRRAEARAALAGVSDPRAVPMVCQVFGRDPRSQAIAVQVLGQVPAPSSSRALAALAVFSPSDDVRRAATETLRQRDPREYADLLIGLIRDPIKYEVRPVGGPGSPGALFVEGERFNVQRLYAPPPIPTIALAPGGNITYDPNGLPILHEFSVQYHSAPRVRADQFRAELDRAEGQRLVEAQHAGQLFDQAGFAPVGAFLTQLATQQVMQDQHALQGQLDTAIAKISKDEHRNPTQFGFAPTYTRIVDHQIPIGQMIVESRRAALVAQQQLQSDLAQVQRYNEMVRQGNDRVAQILRPATGQDLAADREAWKTWWVDQLGYSYKPPAPTPKPTLVEDVPLAYVPRPVPVVASVTSDTVTGFQRMSCFGAGTLVQTRSGPRPIEDLQVGDLVLSQDTETGELSYQPILVVHHNPPSATLKIRIGDEAVVSSTFHRFWRAGQGWAMARDLKVGDPIRTLKGLAEVAEVAPDQVQPVFNLDVAGDRTFFVGRGAALVHDNSVPGLRPSPFDAIAGRVGDNAAPAR